MREICQANDKIGWENCQENDTGWRENCQINDTGGRFYRPPCRPLRQIFALLLCRFYAIFKRIYAVFKGIA